jgi:hypothetical protein
MTKAIYGLSISTLVLTEKNGQLTAEWIKINSNNNKKLK